MKLKSMEFQIGIRKHKGIFLYNNPGLIKDFLFIKNPHKYWLADPFIININGKHFLFAEAATKSAWKGEIVFAEIKSDKINSVKWKKCLKKDFHLSFPNVFLTGNTLCMMPETNEDNCVSIYECNSFENDVVWSDKKIVLSHIQSVDSVALEDYLITYNISGELYKLQFYSLTNRKLLFEIPDLDSKLRPAGKVIISNNILIYPSQDCEREYGGGLIFNQLLIDNDSIEINKFVELDSNFLNAAFNSKRFTGIHTYNSDDEYEVIDIKTNRFSLAGLLKKIISKL